MKKSISVKWLLIIIPVSLIVAVGCLCIFAFGSIYVYSSVTVIQSYYETLPLMTAIKNEDIEKAEQLLKEEHDPNKTDIPQSWINFLSESTPQRPICAAIETGNIEMVQLLIKHGATVGCVEGTGYCPLHCAILKYHNNDMEMIELLLKNGAPLRCAHDSHYYLPFEAANMLPFDHSNGNKIGEKEFSEWYDAQAAKDITDIVLLLLDAGNKHLGDYLIENGCDPSYKNSYGDSAYTYAKNFGNEEMAEYLSQFVDTGK